MLNRFFGQKAKEEARTTPPAPPEGEREPEATTVSDEEQGFNPFKKSLSRTRQFFARFNGPVESATPEAASANGMRVVEPIRPIPITNDMWDELEEALLLADLGPGTSEWLVKRLHERSEEEHMRTAQQVQQALREEMGQLLQAAPLALR